MVVVVEAAVGSVVVASLLVVEGMSSGSGQQDDGGVRDVAAYPTKSADVAHDPKKIAWVTCRTRASRESRCWGVR